MSDEDEDQEDNQPTGGRVPHAFAGLMRPSFPGLRNLWQRFGGRKPPRFDPTQQQVWFQPRFRVTTWTGTADLHTNEECILPHCDNPGGLGHHSEVRPDGFDWCGCHFSCLAEAQENQAFVAWYEKGEFEEQSVEIGKDVMAKGKMVLRPALYRADESPPLPQYNFFLHEHIEKMTRQEIMDYQTRGEVPKRLRRRGRNKQ